MSRAREQARLGVYASRRVPVVFLPQGQEKNFLPRRLNEGCPLSAGILFLCLFPLFFSALACGCCPERAAGRLPGAGHGVRGVSYPSTPPAPPYSPFCGNAEAVS